MGDTLSQLGHLFVQTIPTIILVFLLLLVLEALFFRPITRVLEDREAATAGALNRAREQVAAAESKSREYEAAFQAARQDVYRLREKDRREALAERDSTLKRARERAEAWTKGAQSELAGEVAAAKQELGTVYRPLALEITEAILGEGGRPN